MTAGVLVALPHQPLNDRLLAGLRAGLPDACWSHDPAAFAEDLRRNRPEVVIGGWGTPRLTQALWSDVPSLRAYLHLAGSVRGQVDRGCIAGGLAVSNWGDLAGPYVAEASLAMLLAAMRRIPWFDAALHAGKRWKQPETDPPVRSLIGRRVGIHGFGAIGRCLAPMLTAVGCRVAACDPHVEPARMHALGVEAMDAAALHAACSAVVNLLPAVPATRGLVTRELLASLPDGAVYVLTGRAATVDVDALTDEVASGRLLAALDVFPVEPLPVDAPLRRLPGAILLPHLGMSDDAIDAMVAHAFDRLRVWQAQGRMPGALTVERYDGMT